MAERRARPDPASQNEAMPDETADLRRQIAAVHEPSPRAEPVKRLDGALDRTRITLKPVDPETLRESRRRALLARFALDPDDGD
ncbi:hypothetical protein FSB08_26290 [Paraburkholderia sp. JPY432]|uniref:hypothetical protein n=1 Tax=Paraburkholderia youngii TaxID=2782701 RepID=UPI001595074D|nr:hypothetical protein [Paraburkholderia youngii]NVH75947.1 hypothetical protein [Paraburkholderia youngii]